ncbi:cytochrome c oxidase assembly protein [Roseomonas sp. KE0001]|uniref:cytochrome c oxidase assembly protein n=1 Tax=Roseomonas sp. KE0001 TaxID=2479201 RepID=UPI0018DF5402|nr:cytochrome c oxidase assembly protein [Roseomonas sp. KE0001]MBI0434724.1 cytochrome c oxidase assembly protein [Roseomonas sp. KE0001]
MRGLALPLGLGVLALGVLALAWGGPLRWALGASFTGHMAMHMAVVAVAAPLLALGLAARCPSGGALDRLSGTPVLASAIEFVVIWGWHAPGPHRAARESLGLMALEQASFLAAATLVWLSCLGAGAAESRPRQAAGILGLLLTSMHMTLLGALIGLAPRPLYRHEAYPGHAAHAPGEGIPGLTALEDQALGGVVMLLAGGGAYLAGGLWLAARLLRDPAPEETR